MLPAPNAKALDSVPSSPSNRARARGVAAVVSSPYRPRTPPRALKLFPGRAPPGRFAHTQSPIKMKALPASARLPARRRCGREPRAAKEQVVLLSWKSGTGAMGDRKEKKKENKRKIRT